MVFRLSGWTMRDWQGPPSTGSCPTVQYGTVLDIWTGMWLGSFHSVASIKIKLSVDINRRMSRAAVGKFRSLLSSARLSQLRSQRTGHDIRSFGHPILGHRCSSLIIHRNQIKRIWSPCKPCDLKSIWILMGGYEKATERKNFTASYTNSQFILAEM